MAPLPLPRLALVALAGVVASAAVMLASCASEYRALPGNDAGIDATVPDEPLTCVTSSMLDFPVRFRCSTNGTDDSDCSGANGHSSVVIDRALRTVAGTAILDTASGASTVGRAYAVFTVPGAPRRVTVDYSFSVTNRSAAKMEIAPGCSYAWDDVERTNNFDIDITREGIFEFSYYRNDQGGGAVTTGLPFPNRNALFTVHADVKANERTSAVSGVVQEGQTPFVRADYTGQPKSTQGTLAEFAPTTFSLYCGVILSDGDGTAMRATSTVSAPTVTACYRAGEVPPPPSGGGDAGVADAAPRDGGIVDGGRD
jgi:hypothetical protein